MTTRLAALASARPDLPQHDDNLRIDSRRSRGSRALNPKQSITPSSAAPSGRQRRSRRPLCHDTKPRTLHHTTRAQRDRRRMVERATAPVRPLATHAGIMTTMDPQIGSKSPAPCSLDARAVAAPFRSSRARLHKRGYPALWQACFSRHSDALVLACMRSPICMRG